MQLHPCSTPNCTNVMAIDTPYDVTGASIVCEDCQQQTNNNDPVTTTQEEIMGGKRRIPLQEFMEQAQLKTKTQVAQLFGVSPNTVYYNWSRLGIPSYRRDNAKAYVEKVNAEDTRTPDEVFQEALRSHTVAANSRGDRRFNPCPRDTLHGDRVVPKVKISSMSFTCFILGDKRLSDEAKLKMLSLYSELIQ